MKKFVVVLLVLLGVFTLVPQQAIAASMKTPTSVVHSVQNQNLVHSTKTPNKPQDSWWATCSNQPSTSNCDGQDPQSSGCSDSTVRTLQVAFTGSDIYLYNTKIELRYSRTCNSYWARFSATQSSGCWYNYQATVRRTDGARVASPRFYNQCGSNTIWSPMLYYTGLGQAIGDFWATDGYGYTIYRPSQSAVTNWD